eukprot:m.111535 g.111535  ORF g.111535 m.111535 type:complete len:130 (-) comp9235_c0_seq3:181-570(-)
MHGWMLPAMVLTLLDAKRLPSVGNHNVGNKSDNNEDESDDNDNDVLFSTPSEIIDGLDVKLFAPLATKLFLSPSCTEMDAKEQFMILFSGLCLDVVEVTIIEHDMIQSEKGEEMSAHVFAKKIGKIVTP